MNTLYESSTVPMYELAHAAVLRKHGIAWDQTAVNKGDRK